eukprot:PhF_6_TR39572/c1_g1_i1/m.58663
MSLNSDGSTPVQSFYQEGDKDSVITYQGIPPPSSSVLQIPQDHHCSLPAEVDNEMMKIEQQQKTTTTLESNQTTTTDAKLLRDLVIHATLASACAVPVVVVLFRYLYYDMYVSDMYANITSLSDLSDTDRVRIVAGRYNVINVATFLHMFILTVSAMQHIHPRYLRYAVVLNPVVFVIVVVQSHFVPLYMPSVEAYLGSLILITTILINFLLVASGNKEKVAM